jgi:penicillin V acylase-like amidase (Ntn superfamily)
MNFSSADLKLSVRTLDLGATQNWTISTWPLGNRKHVTDLMHWHPKYATVGLTANWIGDDHWGFPSMFGDTLNEGGLSCSLLTLVDTVYEPKSTDGSKTNVFAGLFCHWASQMFTSVRDVQSALDGIAIWG